MPDTPRFRARPGVLVDTTNLHSPHEYFRHFLNIDIMNLIAEETNRYATDYLEGHPNLPRFSDLRWSPIDVTELENFLGLCLLVGIVKKPRYSDYWATEPLMYTHIFSTIFKRARFQLIMHFLHFNNNNNEPNHNDPDHDRMFKIRPLIDHFNDTFQAAIQPEQEIALDESLLLFKGKLHFKQYIPAKRSRFGIKIFQVCESKTGYSYKFLVYQGKMAPTFGIENQMANVRGATNTDKLTVAMIEPLLD